MKFNLKIKLLITMVIIGVVPLLVATFITSEIAKDSLVHETLDKLNISSEIKQTQIVSYFKEREADLFILSKRKDIKAIFDSFINYHKKTGVNSNQIYPVNTEEWNKIVDDMEDLTSDFLENYGYYDIFFICANHGHVMYSENQESDLGENLSSGELKNSGLAKTYQNVVKEKGFVFQDFEPYSPSNNQYSAFLGYPVFDKKEKLIGVIALQLDKRKINQIVQERTGMGNSGESYLVGLDKNNTTSFRCEPILRNKKIGDEVSNKAIKLCFFEKKENTVRQLNENGIIEYNHYHYFELYGNQWGLFSAINADEILEPVAKLQSTMLILGFVGIVLIALFSLYFANTLSRPIISLTEMAKQISIGNLKQKIITKTKDEIGALTESFQKMQTNLTQVVEQAKKVALGDYKSQIEPKSEKDELSISINNMTISLDKLSTETQKQNWLKTGQNKLNEVMRGDLDIPTLSNNIITYLAKYLEASIGAFYVYYEEKETLKLTGSFAFTMRKGLSKTYNIGEGIVGQAALEKKIISLTEIPENYIRINSALGDSIPKNIIVAPIILNNVIKGVIEFGAFREFTNEQLELINMVDENIAISINSAIARTKLKKLFETTKEQAVSLQEQQEMLQTSNEELEEQTKKLLQSEIELKAQQEELQTSNEELEEQTQKLRESELELKSQQEELQTTNEELEEKTQYLAGQKEEIQIKNSELETTKLKLEKKAKELEITSKYKSEFLANMSHELRTPLNSLLILSQDLANNKPENLTEDQIESAEIINKSGNDLLLLINDILDLSKIEAGKMNINVDKIFLHDFIKNLSKDFTPMANQKGLTLDINFEDNLPNAIYSDPLRTNQIMRNLISNAVKFTEEGKVILKIHRPANDIDLSRSGLDRNKTIGISVIDNGIGIPSEKLNEIFEAFHQIDGSTSRKYTGTGLGLSITRELVKILKGEIQVKSVEDKGSTFTVYLPISINDNGLDNSSFDTKFSCHSEINSNLNHYIINNDLQGQESFPAPTIDDDRENLHTNDRVILVIEDDLNFATTLHKFCKERNFKFIHSADGRNGIDLAKKHLPDAIILDIKLPGIEGWGVLQALKDNSTTRHIPIHMMSVEEENIDALKKGAIGYLTKPITNSQLNKAFEKIEDLMERNIKDLLIIEDDQNLQKSIVKLIGNGDVKSKAVSTGFDAMNELETVSYDCVILDLNLPDYSGFELLKKIEESNEITVPPIIVYTGRELTKEEDYELQKYASSIIIKGVKSEERLLDETALFLHRVVDNLPTPKKNIITKLHDKDALFENKRILLADDDMRNVYAISKILEDKGMEVLKAPNGQKSLEILEKENNIDLVLMDIMMPIMDGYDAMKEIRKQEKLWNLPIIALTAKAMKEDRDKCISAGANDYLPKPVDIDRLLSLIRVWLYK